MENLKELRGHHPELIALGKWEWGLGVVLCFLP